MTQSFRNAHHLNVVVAYIDIWRLQTGKYAKQNFHQHLSTASHQRFSCVSIILNRDKKHWPPPRFLQCCFPWLTIDLFLLRRLQWGEQPRSGPEIKAESVLSASEERAFSRLLASRQFKMPRWVSGGVALSQLSKWIREITFEKLHS